MPQILPDGMSETGQKLCQNSVSGWGSFEEAITIFSVLVLWGSIMFHLQMRHFQL